MARKKAVPVALFDKENYKAAMRLVRASGLPYIIKRTNYTAEIDSPILKIKYLTSMMSDHPVILHNMIKRDIKESGICKPEILKAQLKFFSFNEEEILKRAKGNEIFNIDIRSAYSNVLNNYGLLRPNTFKYLSNVSKVDRLAAVGMLASSKDIFVFDGINRHPISDTTETKETENWFWLCVLEIQEIMLHLKFMIGADFLFYWVDGIFFTGIENKLKIECYLNEKKYQNSFEQCFGYRYYKEGNVKYLRYWKPKGELFELKVLNMPVVDQEAKDFVIRFCKLIGKENNQEDENIDNG